MGGKTITAGCVMRWISIVHGMRPTQYEKYSQAGDTPLNVGMKALQDKAQGTFVAPHKLTLGAWLDTWLWEYKKPCLRPITFDSYEMLIRRHLKPALGHIALRDLRPEHVQHFYNEKAREGFSARTIRYLHTTLHSALAQAEKNQLVARNVSKLTEPPGESRKEMRTLSLSQVADTLLPAIKDDRLYAAFFLAFTTGLRRGELLALRWRDVDLKSGILQVRQTLVRSRNHEEGRSKIVFSEPKTPQSRRTIPLLDECLNALKQHRAKQAEEKLMLGAAYEDYGLVFRLPNGKPLEPRNFNRRFSNILKQAGLPHIRLHDSRHTFATLLLEQGVSPKTVQTMLGHSSSRITLDIYSHVTLELEKQAAAKLNAALTERGK
jgi:integrase